jgi:hypothetical protein
MIADCDLRTSRVIESEVRRELEEQYGSVFELVLLKIVHEGDQVRVLGEFVRRLGEQEIRFLRPCHPRTNSSTIFSDRFVHLDNGGRTILGLSFPSSSNLCSIASLLFSNGFSNCFLNLLCSRIILENER